MFCWRGRSLSLRLKKEPNLESALTAGSLLGSMDMLSSISIVLCEIYTVKMSTNLRIIDYTTMYRLFIAEQSKCREKPPFSTQNQGYERFPYCSACGFTLGNKPSLFVRCRREIIAAGEQ